MNRSTAISPAVSRLKPSATLAIHETYRQLAARGEQVFRLGLGQSPFPVPAHVVMELQARAHQKAYLPARGLPELCEAISGYLLRTENVDCRPEHVLVGPGTKELMFLLQFVCRAELLLPSPGWVSYAPQAAVVGRAVSWLCADDHGGGLSAEALNAHCGRRGAGLRLLVLNYPNNPSGYSYTPQELAEIAGVCRRHQILVLSDEIYSGTHFEGDHVSIARYYPEGTIVSNGLSKWCGAGGWRLGWFAFPAELAELHLAMQSLITETFSSVNSPVQYAAVVALAERGEMDEYLLHSRGILKSLAFVCAERLRDAGAKVSDPRGGFYLFPRFPDIKGFASSAALCQALLQTAGVALLPGSEFGRSPAELSVRLACVDFDGDAALRAAKTAAIDEDFVRRYCAPTLEAIERLAHWLSERGQPALR